MKWAKRGNKLKKITKTKKLKYLRFPSKISELKNGKHFLVGTYNKMKTCIKKFSPKSPVEAHHLLEKRVLNKTTTGSLKQGNMMSVALSKELHQEVTNRWRRALPYGTDYSKLKKTEMIQVINKVYSDMPVLKKYAKKYLDEIWIGK